MPRQKKLNLIVHYGKTSIYVNDLGEAKSPRFELYDLEAKTVIAKSNNPTEFDAYLNKIYPQIGGKDDAVQKCTKAKTKRA